MEIQFEEATSILTQGGNGVLKNVAIKKALISKRDKGLVFTGGP